MFEFRQLAVTSMVAICVGTGCCLTRPCGIPGNCGNEACGFGGTACCDAQPAVRCDDGGCGNGCGNGCARLGSLLRFRCLGRLLRMSCNSLGCGSGCGEVYWHDWISDPPCPDPCDTCGNWTGMAVTNSYDGSAGPGVFSQPIPEPSYVGPTFRGSGSLLYSGFMGVSSLGNRLKRGLVPQYGGCATCATGSNGSAFVVGSGIPVDVTTQQISPVPGRPPHPVVAERFR